MDGRPPTAVRASEIALEHLGYNLHYWQEDFITAQQDNDGDVLGTAPTGGGKTATIIIPIIMNPKRITLIVSPLNLLTDQTNLVLKKAGVESVALTSETSNQLVLKVCCQLRHFVSLMPF